MRLLLLLSIAISGALGFTGQRILKESEILKEKIAAVDADCENISKSTQAVEKYPDGPQNDVIKVYIDLMNNIKLITVFNDADTEVIVLDSKDGMNIKEFAKDSRYAGIKILNVGIFVNVKNQINIPPLLESIQKLQKIYPFEITKIKIKDNHIEISGDLYGA